MGWPTVAARACMSCSAGVLQAAVHPILQARCRVQEDQPGALAQDPQPVPLLGQPAVLRRPGEGTTPARPRRLPAPLACQSAALMPSSCAHVLLFPPLCAARPPAAQRLGSAGSCHACGGEGESVAVRAAQWQPILGQAVHSSDTPHRYSASTMLLRFSWPRWSFWPGTLAGRRVAGVDSTSGMHACLLACRRRRGQGSSWRIRPHATSPAFATPTCHLYIPAAAGQGRHAHQSTPAHLLCRRPAAHGAHQQGVSCGVRGCTS